MSALEAAPRAKRQRSTTVVFVDVVGSTGLAARMGDEQWAWLLEEYQALVRRELAAWGGEEMDTAGDGLFAVFADPAAALGFGCSVRQAVRRLGLQVRVGAHTGTCWVADEKCTGARREHRRACQRRRRTRRGARFRPAARAPGRALDVRIPRPRRVRAQRRAVPAAPPCRRSERRRQDDIDQRSRHGLPGPSAGRRDRRLAHAGSHGSNVVYKRLRERGYQVFAVNPNADEVEGDRAYHDLARSRAASRPS